MTIKDDGSERVFKANVLVHFGMREDVWIWNNPTGVFRAYDNPNRVVRVGIAGQPDLMGIWCRPNQWNKNIREAREHLGLRPKADKHWPEKFGQALAIEVKRKGGRQSLAQLNWQLA